MIKTKTIKKHTFYNRFIKLYGLYNISNLKKYDDAINYSIELLNKNKILGIFPEGKKRSSLGKFNKGAAYIALESNATVLPMYIYGKYSLFRRTRVNVGKPFKVSELNLKSSNKMDKVEEVNNILYNKMLNLSKE